MGPVDSHRISRVPRYSGCHYNYKQKRIRGFHPLWPYFPVCSAISFTINVVILQPRLCRNIIGLGCSPFARHYLGNHYYFLFLQVLRCFSSLRSPPYLLIWIPLLRWVFPFGHLRVTGYLRLTAAFRSLSRPSSPPWAKASAMRPFLVSFAISCNISNYCQKNNHKDIVFICFLSCIIMSKIFCNFFHLSTFFLLKVYWQV